LPFTLDLSKRGLEKIFREYQIKAMKVIWESTNDGLTSREVYDHVNRVLEDTKSISRASIINFLNAMCDEGVLNYKEETCKGGVRRRYSKAMDEERFMIYVAKSALESLMRDFPIETRRALSDHL
jgi:predicted transcriptional regulator